MFLRQEPSSVTASGEVSMGRALEANVELQLLSDVSALREKCSRTVVNFTKYWFWRSCISIVSEPQSSVFEVVNH